MDVSHLKTWIGRTESAEERLTAALVDRFCATLGCARADAAPPFLHWCLTQPVAPMDALGPDGHPARGGFLPPVPLPRRMWAGGAVTHHAPLPVDSMVTRVSTITDVAHKAGRSGDLIFVTVAHAFSADDRLCVEERQDIVYRGAAGATPPPAKSAPVGEERRIAMTPTLLFRYSALTFNGHRIHYDAPYATAVEGYGGLVVHGPLQATLLGHWAADLLGQTPKTLTFRGVSPVFAPGDLILAASRHDDGITLATHGPDGRLAMTAEARL
ncbi:MAG: MaoC family dehydratase N-terminal domain-containing protein [Pseudomonadota bacterium]